MRVFKFGGASVKDAEGVRNLVRVLETTGTDQTFLVVSAMGKSTNAMEAVVDAYFKDRTKFTGPLEDVRSFLLKAMRYTGRFEHFLRRFTGFCPGINLRSTILYMTRWSDTGNYCQQLS
jgi:aspartokinase